MEPDLYETRCTLVVLREYAARLNSHCTEAERAQTTWFARRRVDELRAQIQRELILCTRIVKLGSQVLENTKVSSFDAFALEVILFETEQAINRAQTLLGDPPRIKKEN